MLMIKWYIKLYIIQESHKTMKFQQLTTLLYISKKLQRKNYPKLTKSLR